MGELDAANVAPVVTAQDLSLLETAPFKKSHLVSTCLPPFSPPLTMSVCPSAASRLQDLYCSSLTGFPGLLSDSLESMVNLYNGFLSRILNSLVFPLALRFTSLSWSCNPHSLLHGEDAYITVPNNDAPLKELVSGIFWGSKCYPLGPLFSSASSFPLPSVGCFWPPVSPLSPLPLVLQSVQVELCLSFLRGNRALKK